MQKVTWGNDEWWWNLYPLKCSATCFISLSHPHYSELQAQCYNTSRWYGSSHKGCLGGWWLMMIFLPWSIASIIQNSASAKTKDKYIGFELQNCSNFLLRWPGRRIYQRCLPQTSVYPKRAIRCNVFITRVTLRCLFRPDNTWKIRSPSTIATAPVIMMGFAKLHK